MAERSYPREWLGELPGESARWVQHGIISDAQRAAILGLYPARAGEARDRTVLIISILGSLLVGAGVILFFAANWPRIPAAVKVASILAATVGAYASGYYLQFVRGDYPRLGHSLILLGSLLYGAGIWLVAQIFHLESRFSNGFLFWGAGLLPLIWATSSRPVLYLTTVLLVIWTATEQGAYASYNLLYPVLALGVLIPLSRRLQSALAEAGTLLGLFLWVAINVARGEPNNISVGNELVVVARTMLLYGAAVVTLGLAQLGDARAYLSVGSLLALAGSYILSFDVYYQVALPSVVGGSPFLIAATWLLLAVVAAGAWFYWRRGEAGRLALLPALALQVVGAVLAHALPEVTRMVAFNLLLFGGTVGLVVLGVQRRSELLINLGLVAFVVHILTRYFDLFFDAMDKSLFFILGGILLLGGGWLLERNRRRWIGDWGGDQQ